MKNLIEKIKLSCSETGILIRICFLLLGNIFLPAFIASLGFIFNLSINNFTYIVSQIILLILYYIFFYKKDRKKEFIIPIIIMVVTVILSIFISNNIYDNSVDGWGYHNPAIIKLSEGWNPLFEHYDDESILGIWSEHYPKVIWIYGATLYKITKVFFVGSSFNIIISCATFFLIWDVLKKRKLNKFLSPLLSFIITFSTINVAQMFTLYNDGVFGLCIIGALILYDCLLRKEYQLNSVNMLLLAFYLAILANIKFNGALYALIIALVYSIILFIKKILKIEKKLFVYIAIIGVSVLAVASNTYLPNFIHHKNIGYPILGDNKIEIIKQYIPNYIGKDDGKIEQFVKSITSSSYNEYHYNPFYITSSVDYTCASTSDCRINGFGPLYQTLVILTGIFIFAYLVKLIKSVIKKEITIKSYVKDNYFKFIPLIFMLIFFFLAPATWWVRYVPYMYVVPLILVIDFNDEWSKINITNIFVYGMITIYLISFFGIGENMLKQSLTFTDDVKKEINYIKEYNNEFNNLDIAPIDAKLIHNSYRQSMTYKYLENRGLKYEIHNTYECTIVQNLDSLAISIVDCGGNDDSKN